jgi:GR25 family glycosyltransferase involved in LPS biosynthesis
MILDVRICVVVLTAIVVILYSFFTPCDTTCTCEKKYAPFRIPSGMKLNTYMITLPNDKWKRDRFQESMDAHELQIDYKQWEGVMIRNKPEVLRWALENKLGHVTDERRKGNIGSALAHIKLWDFVATCHDNEHFLIFEDNVLAAENSRDAFWDMHDLDYDMIYLTALRPTGKPTNKQGLLQVTHNPSWRSDHKNKHLAPNIWLSSYLLKPRGARHLLQYLKEYNFDLSRMIIDQAVSKAISLDESQRMKVFVVTHRKYFGHIETENDTRVRENGGAR